MNEKPILTDTSLEAMLVRRAGPAAPAGLAEAIGAALAVAPDARRPWWPFLALPGGRTPALRLAWVVAVVGLLLAAAVSAIFVGGELLRRVNHLTVVPPSTVAPVPSGAPLPSAAPTAGPVAVVTRPIDQVNDLDFAADGSLWLATGVGAVHWDVAKGSATLYGQNEGLPATTALQVAVAPDGGVWAGGGDWLARFDGRWTAFTEFGAAGRVVELGGLAFGPDGTLATSARARHGAPPYLLRYDGRWSATRIAGAEDEAIQAGCGRLDVAPDGTVWVNTCFSGVLAFDGSRWTPYDASTTGLPSDPMLAGVAPDGSVWIEMGAWCESETRCSNPGHGVARFDGTSWTVYATDAGLALDAGLGIGDDGSVWAVGGGSVSRFDGARWIAAEAPDLAKAYLLAVARDGALWLRSPDGLLRLDGTTVTPHALPIVETAAELPPVELTPAAGEDSATTPSALGTITWQTYESPPGRDFWGVTGTAHAPVVVDGNDLRWLDADGTWAGTTLPISPWRVTAVGDEIIAHGQGAVRLSWDGSRWVVGDTLDLPASLGFVRQVTAGLRSTVLTAGTSVAFSSDGRHFAMAARGPDPAVLATGVVDSQNVIGCSVVTEGWAGGGEPRPGLRHRRRLRRAHGRQPGQLEQLAALRAGGLVLGGRIDLDARVARFAFRQGGRRPGRREPGRPPRGRRRSGDDGGRRLGLG